MKDQGPDIGHFDSSFLLHYSACHCGRPSLIGHRRGLVKFYKCSKEVHYAQELVTVFTHLNLHGTQQLKASSILLELIAVLIPVMEINNSNSQISLTSIIVMSYCTYTSSCFLLASNTPSEK